MGGAKGDRWRDQERVIDDIGIDGDPAPCASALAVGDKYVSKLDS